MANLMQLGDVGTVIRATVTDGSAVIDLSSTVTKQLLLRKPDGSLLTKTASFVTDGTDGRLSYTIISGDLDQIGTWKLQAYVTFAATQWHTNTASFDVLANLP